MADNDAVIDALRAVICLLDGQTEPLHPVSWQVELLAAKRALEAVAPDSRTQRVDKIVRVNEAYKVLVEQAGHQLSLYGQHLNVCATRLCVICGHGQWMHDRTEDLDEVTCIQHGQSFIAKECDCGLSSARLAYESAVLDSAEELPDPEYGF